MERTQDCKVHQQSRVKGITNQKNGRKPNTSGASGLMHILVIGQTAAQISSNP